jgi:uncharacterized protein (DUF2267 family)
MLARSTRIGLAAKNLTGDSTMSAQGMEVLDHTVQLTHEWINELDKKLGWNNRNRAFRLLRVTLQTLRDCLPIEEQADVAAQLPILLRGVFYEHWRPGAERKRYDLAAFLGRIYDAFPSDPLTDAEGAIMICFDLLSRKIARGEVAQARQSLPAALRALWPAQEVGDRHC